MLMKTLRLNSLTWGFCPIFSLVWQLNCRIRCQSDALLWKIDRAKVLATLIGDILGILFAFVTNDTTVSSEKDEGWAVRLVKNFHCRLAAWNLLLTLYLCPLASADYWSLNPTTILRWLAFTKRTLIAQVLWLSSSATSSAKILSLKTGK